ncbi:glycosyltransferase family 2 protein [Litoreibacter sp.]|nr:glycosyltransferase family 2 protein [Litoreibacter sp.]
MTNLGVVIVTYNAADVIRDCLETLLSSGHPMDVLVIDNASTDGTTQSLANWYHGVDDYTPPTDLPFDVVPVPKPTKDITVIESSVNGGFAAGVNIGIRHLLAKPNIDRIWILNPDTLVPPNAPAAFANAPSGFSLMGGRILYASDPHCVQTDGGTINRWSGVTGNLNLGRRQDAPMANIADAEFISGASMVASRAFIEQSGTMCEDYFLYYEEVDWAMKRGPLPLAFCPDATIYHRAGTAIGSPTLTQIASPFSTYYKYRARMMFLRKFYPMFRPIGYLYAAAKAAQFLLKGHNPQVMAILRAINGLKRSTDKAAQSGHQPIQRRT